MDERNAATASDTNCTTRVVAASCGGVESIRERNGVAAVSQRVAGLTVDCDVRTARSRESTIEGLVPPHAPDVDLARVRA